jgi:hypothetical protein
MQTHEQELEELFLGTTVSLSPDLDGQQIRAISFDGFKLAVDKMMEKAFFYGENAGMKRAEQIADEVFK